MSDTPPRATLPIVRAIGVNHFFGVGAARAQALFDVNLEVLPGELVAFSGPTGAGKTTLLTLLGGQRTLQEGDVEIGDSEPGQFRNLRRLDRQGLVQVRRQIGFVFQRPNLIEPLTALENVRLPLPTPKHKGAEVRAKELLARLGLGEQIHHKPGQLSVEQRQLVAVARALVNEPRLILADEPTAALEGPSGEVAIGLLRQLVREQGRTILVVTQDSRILSAADRLVTVQRGRIASNVVLAERLFIYEGLRRCPPLAALLPQELFEIAVHISIGLAPDQAVTPEDVERASAVKRARNLPLGIEVHSAGSTIMQQGDVGDKCYLIRRGQVGVLVDGGAGPMQVLELGRQEVFGDGALLTDKPRNASVVALGPVELYALDRETFEQARDRSGPFIEGVLAVYGSSSE